MAAVPLDSVQDSKQGSELLKLPKQVQGPQRHLPQQAKTGQSRRYNAVSLH